MRCPSWSSRRCARRRRRTCDNVTVLAVEWEAAEEPGDNAARACRPVAGRRGVRLHHTGQRARRATPGDELDDAEIERSIREINEAIRRSEEERCPRSPNGETPLKGGAALHHALSFQSRAIAAAAPMTACARFASERGYTRHAEGSVLVAFGDTKVLCTASVEEKVPPHKRGSGQGWVTAEYGMLPRATHTRSDREAARGKQSGRTQEIQRLIGRSCAACSI